MFSTHRFLHTENRSIRHGVVICSEILISHTVYISTPFLLRVLGNVWCARSNDPIYLPGSRAGSSRQWPLFRARLVI